MGMKRPDNPSAITDRVARGVGVNVLAQVVNIFGQLVLVPLFIACWGVQLYGEWLTIAAAVGYLSIADFGMQMFVINRLNQCHAVGALDEYNRILHSAYFLSIIIATASLILFIAAFVFLPINIWFNIVFTDRKTAVIVLILLATQVAFSIPIGLIAGIYRTIGEYPRSVMIGLAQRVASIIITAAILSTGAQLSVVALAQILPLIAVAIFVWLDLRRRHPEIHLGVRHRNMRQALSFLVPSFFFFLIQMATVLTLQGSTLVVGALYGAGAVAVFVTLRVLVNTLRQAFSAVNHALWPELTALDTMKRFETIREINLFSSKAMLLFSVCGALFLLFEGNDLVYLWTRREIIYDHRLMIAFLLLLISQTFWGSSSIVLGSSNNHRLLGLCYIVSGLLGVSLGYFFGRLLGMQGVVLGLLIGDLLICSVIVPLQACRLIGQGYVSFVTEVLLRGVPVVIALISTLYLVTSTLGKVPIVLRLAIVLLTTALVGFLAGYYIWFQSTERKRLDILLGGIMTVSVSRVFTRE
jgi:O-antigen/teichoic acid export membrane protein